MAIPVLEINRTIFLCLKKKFKINLSNSKIINYHNNKRLDILINIINKIEILL